MKTINLVDYLYGEVANHQMVDNYNLDFDLRFLNLKKLLLVCPFDKPKLALSVILKEYFNLLKQVRDLEKRLDLVQHALE